MQTQADNSRSKIMVTGAEGFLGSHLIRALRARHYDVLCCGRNAKRLQNLFPECLVIEADFSEGQRPEYWTPHLDGVSTIINTAGIFQEHGRNTFVAAHRDGPIALFQAAERAGVNRVIQVSALGADQHSTTPYHVTKHAADMALSQLALEWIVIQPSIIYGSEGRSLAFLSGLAALPLIPLVGKGDQLLQPVSIDDVTTAVLHLVPSSGPAKIVVAAVGGDALSLRQMLNRLRLWLGFRPTVELGIPLCVMHLFAKLGQLLRWEFVHSGALSMLCRGNVANPTPFSKILGRTPRTFTDSFQPHHGTTADRWQASLYFLRPALRLSIASVWIITGIISLWIYPRESSEHLLIQAGFSQAIAPYLLNGLAVTDIGLGIGTWMKWHMSIISITQLCLIIAYSLVIATALPEFVIHPFGAIVKNGPLFVATMVMMALEGDR